MSFRGVERGETTRNLLFLWDYQFPKCLLDLNHAFGGGRLDLLHSFHHASGKLEQRLGVRRVLTFQRRWLAFVSGFANLRIELNAAEEIYSKLPCGLLCPATREDVHLM